MTKSYEVRMSDSVENTGLDCQFFASREEAESAAATVNDMFPRAGAEVSESDEEPTITLSDWEEAGW